MSISNGDKKHYRRIGNKLKPVVTIGSKGLSDTVRTEIDRALRDHELVKIKFDLGDRESRRAISDEICSSLRCELAQSIGHVSLIFRKSSTPDPKLSNLLRRP
jgi:RNA-binding protein